MIGLYGRTTDQFSRKTFLKEIQYIYTGTLKLIRIDTSFEVNSFQLKYSKPHWFSRINYTFFFLSFQKINNQWRCQVWKFTVSIPGIRCGCAAYFAMPYSSADSYLAAIPEAKNWKFSARLVKHACGKLYNTCLMYAFTLIFFNKGSTLALNLFLYKLIGLQWCLFFLNRIDSGKKLNILLLFW